MRSRQGNRFTRVLVLAGVLGPAFPAVLSAATFSITPSTVASNFGGTIVFDIAALAAGQAVRVDAILDRNANDVADAGEPIVQSFKVADGQVTAIGGVRLPAVPGDDDGAVNGRIRVEKGFPGAPFVTRSVARYVYRVAAVGGGFNPLTARFTVTQPDYGQQVTGRVTSGGAPVPYAYAFLIEQDGSDDGPAVLTVAGADGRFTLKAPPGDYAVGALRDGFLFTAPAAVTLGAGATVGQDLSMLPADRTISGRLSDATSGAGIAGVMLFCANNSEGSFEDGALATLAFTDIDGNFVVPVVSGPVWGIYAEEDYARQGGYLGTKTDLVDAQAGNVTDVSIQWPRANAVVYGTLTGMADQAIGGVAVSAYGPELSTAVEEPEGTTDADGNYVIGVLAGQWYVNPDGAQLAELGYVVPETKVAMVGVGEARQVDFVAIAPTAHLRGRLVDSSGNPVGDIGATVCASMACSERTGTGGDGNFDFGVVGGSWSFFFRSDQLAARSLVGPMLSVQVSDGMTADLGDVVALPVAGYIRGWVHLDDGTPLSGIGVYAYAGIGSIPYRSEVWADGNGDFALPAANGIWPVQINCYDFFERGYRCPAMQSVTVNNNDPVLNFIVQRVAACGGDCNGDGEVTVDELITMVNIALGTANVGACLAGDANLDGEITIDEIVVAVNHALVGCGG